MICREVAAAVAADLGRRSAREALLAKVLASEIAALQRITTAART